MRLLKRTYALPHETLEQFEQAVTPGKRSAIVAQVLRDWLDKQRQEQLRHEVIEGCREMADVYLEIEQEYHPLEEEVARALDARPQTRRYRTRAARPRRRV
jgi:metal-responsive CopG/Arc/MetJ family transcriptional regulator